MVTKKANNKMPEDETQDLVKDIRIIPFTLAFEGKEFKPNEISNALEILRNHNRYVNFFTNGCQNNFNNFVKALNLSGSNFDKIENSPSNAFYPGVDPVAVVQKDKEMKETFSEVTKASLSKKKTKLEKQPTVLEENLEFEKQYRSLDFPRCKSNYFSERFFKIGNYFVDCLYEVLEKDVKTLETKKKELMLNPVIPIVPPKIQFDPTQALLDYRNFLSTTQLLDPNQIGQIWRPVMMPPNNLYQPLPLFQPLSLDTYLLQMQKSRELAEIQQFQRQQRIQNNKNQKKKKNKI